MIKTKKVIGGGAVCKQLDLLKKLRRKKTISTDMIDLAEAQAQDYVEMNKRLTNIESKVSEIESGVARIDGKLDALMQQVNGPAEAERVDGIKWRTFTNWTKTKTFWIMVIIVVLAFMFAGPDLGKLLIGWIPLGS